jgi:hypothetical protein
MTRPAIAALAAVAERNNKPPIGAGERFAVYGLMGVPFSSGHVLAMRRSPASSVGPAYTSVWHRNPNGGWEFWQDQDDEFACPRYFSRALAESRRCTIGLDCIRPLGAAHRSGGAQPPVTPLTEARRAAATPNRRRCGPGCWPSWRRSSAKSTKPSAAMRRPPPKGQMPRRTALCTG